MDRYDKWTEDKLRRECNRRKLSHGGHKSKLAQRIARDDEEKQQATSHLAFDQKSDPDGVKEATHLNSQARFDRNYWNSVVGSELEFHEAMAKSKKAELVDVLKSIEEKFQVAMNNRDARVARYKEASTGSVLPSPALTHASLVIEIIDDEVPSPEHTRGPSTKKLPTPSAVPQLEFTPSAKPQAIVSPIDVPPPPPKKAHLPMPVIESAFYKAPYLKDARATRAKKAAPEPQSKSTSEKSTTEAGATAPVAKKATSSAKSQPIASPIEVPPPPANKVYLPMPVIESAFHKTPPPKAGRKPRAKKAAPEPEPKRAPKKFMTQAGAEFLKALDGSKNTDYEKFIAEPSKSKRPTTETEQSVAKKLRLNPEQTTIKEDRYHAMVEKESVQEALTDDGYLFLPCEDEKKIRGDRLTDLSYQYRAFAVTKVRADSTGYFMVFERTVKGDRDLKKCLGLIDLEIGENTFFDKNVTDVKMSKRPDAVEELEPDSEPESEPEREEVNLGHTFVPYKKPAPRRGRW
ncbi:hypothetical protein VTL71DRAFT_5089 [Oculimacula yallundae]|uniref:SAP domain-containing protein n=1 Tax=Oculimacula yallundae TaxID=86028 RepID=A0ABR4C057_9HELO